MTVRQLLTQNSKAGLAVSLSAFAVFAPISIAGMGIATALCIIFYAADRRSRPVPGPRGSDLDGVVVIFIASFIPSVLFSTDFMKSINTVRSLWSVVIFYIASRSLGEKSAFTRMAGIVAAVAAVNSIYAVVQHFTGIDLFRVHAKTTPAPYGDGFIGKGTFSHHLIFSNVMVMAAGLNMGLIAMTRGKKRLAFIGTFLLILAGLAFSFSRGPWLALVIATGFFISIRGGKLPAIAALSAAAAFAALIFMYEPLRERAQSALSTGENEDRLLLWRGTLDMIADHPLVGIGPGAYKKEILPYIERFHHEFSAWGHAHNSYLHLFAESGVFTFICYVALLFSGIRLGVRTFLADRDDPFSCMALGAAAAILGFSIAGLFQANFNDAVSAFNLWFLLGMVGALANMKKARGI